MGEARRSAREWVQGRVMEGGSAFGRGKGRVVVSERVRKE